MLRSQYSFFRTLCVGFLLIVSLSSCTLAIIGATIATIDVLHDRRTAGEYFDDSNIELTAKKYLLSSPALRKGAHVKVESWNGILLLTGEITQQALKQQIVNKLKNYRGVRQLVDETIISAKSLAGRRVNDTWITSKVKSKMVLNTGVNANRIKVITTRGNVYLMGIVTKQEGELSTALARKVKGVTRVIKVFEYTPN